MVEDRVRSGRRVAQLLASELRGHEDGPLGRLSVVDIRDAEGSEAGEFAYGVDCEVADGEVRLADVFVQEGRARVEFRERPDVAAETASEAGLRVRPKATDPPRTLVFVEDGVQVKRALRTFRASATALAE